MTSLSSRRNLFLTSAADVRGCCCCTLLLDESLCCCWYCCACCCCCDGCCCGCCCGGWCCCGAGASKRGLLAVSGISPFGVFGPLLAPRPWLVSPGDGMLGTGKPGLLCANWVIPWCCIVGIFAFRGLLMCWVPTSMGGGCREGVSGSECWLDDSDENGVGVGPCACSAS